MAKLRYGQKLRASTCVMDMGYAPPIKTLYLTFPTGKTYAYMGVSPALVRAMGTSGSLGQFFNLVIKGKYRDFKVPGIPASARGFRTGAKVDRPIRGIRPPLVWSEKK